MGQDKTTINKIQDYYNLSLNYLESAKISLKKELYEPAMFNAIHALELSLKAALLTSAPRTFPIASAIFKVLS